MEKLQHIQDITDARGNVHSVLIYGKGDLRLGNKKFSSMKWVKYYIEEAYGVMVEKFNLSKNLNDELLRTMGRNLNDFSTSDIKELYEICKTETSIRNAVSKWQLS